MSAKCLLNCSAVELWYKMMLEIRNQSDLTENHTKRKAAGFQRLSSNWLWLFMAVYKPSFSDAEFGKDGIQYVLRRDFTGNSAQMVQNFADVLSEQVSGNASCKSILGPVRGSACGF